MAYEWVAPIAGAATGIAGIALSWATNRKSVDVQLELATAQHDHEVDRERRGEKREVYSRALDRLAAFDRMVVAEGPNIRNLLRQSHAELQSEVQPRADDPKGGEVVEFDGTDSEAVQSAASALEGDQADEYAAAYQRIDDAFEDFDEHFSMLLLTGPAAVRAAALAVRDDLLDVELDVMRGEWRYLKPALRNAMLDAMRKDLGNDDADDATGA